MSFAEAISMMRTPSSIIARQPRFKYTPCLSRLEQAPAWTWTEVFDRTFGEGARRLRLSSLAQATGRCLLNALPRFSVRSKSGGPIERTLAPLATTAQASPMEWFFADSAAKTEAQTDVRSAEMPHSNDTFDHQRRTKPDATPGQSLSVQLTETAEPSKGMAPFPQESYRLGRSATRRSDRLITSP